MNKKRITLLLLPALLLILAVCLTACNLFGSTTTVTITFISNGGSVCEPMTINDGDVFTKDDFPVPQKSGYTFYGWYVDENFETPLIDYLINNTVKKSFKAYARWFSDPHSVSVIKNAEGGAVTGEGKYSEGEQVTLTATVGAYHTWEGWYDGNSLLSGETTYTFTMGLTDKVINARWICKMTSNATFYKNYDLEGIYVERPAGYRENNISIPAPVRQNYYFVGWNTEADGSGTTINEANDRTLINDYGYMNDKSFYAIWSINTYSADDIDELSVKITAYNGSDEVIFLPDAIDGKTVVALGGIANAAVKEVVIPYTVSQISENALPASVEKIYLAPGSVLSADDEAFNDSQVYVNVNNYESGSNVNYYCYMDGIFADTELNDEDEHRAFFKYLRLYNITERFELHCAYATGAANAAAFGDYCENLTTQLSIHFKCNLSNSYSIQREKKSGAFPYYVTYGFTLKLTDEINSVTSEGGAMQTQGAPVHVNYVTVTDEHTLAIDSLSPIAVYNSEQLVSAVERGFKPVFPQTGTTAEAAYIEARAALLTFIGANMTDLEKIKAIHDYLALNVIYDSWVYNNANALEANGSISTYRAFFLEGVFLDKKAVCDGIAKAFMLMCRMEGIVAVRVSGDSNGTGHAWNKVFLNEGWYCVDVTKDDSQISNSGKQYEFLNHLYFMRSDSEFVELGNVATDGTTASYPAPSDYDYYSNTKYEPDASLAPSEASDYILLANYFSAGIGSESGLYSLDFYSTDNTSTVMGYFSGYSSAEPYEYGDGFVYVVMKFK